jgi:hypothetical protein
MPAVNETPVPDDITWTDITDDQVEFLRRTFSREAPDEGLIVSFQETSQPDGLKSLVIHFDRFVNDPAAPAAAQIQGNLAWGARVSQLFGDQIAQQFKDKVRAIAAQLGTDPNFLMAAIAFETGRTFSASVANQAGSGAVGLIQFMPRTAVALGTTSAALSAMSPVAQLDLVQKYFLPYAGNLHSLADLYMAILWPVAVAKSDDFVLFSQSINPAAYRQNRGLDVNGDGKVTKAEAASKVEAMLTEGLKPGNIG